MAFKGSPNILQEVVRREQLSLLTYAEDAFPWTKYQNEAALTRLLQIVGEHRAAIAPLFAYMTRHRIPWPYIGSFPASFTAANFLALDHVQTLLVESEQKLLGQLEVDIGRMADPDIKALLEQFAAVKRDHLARLKSLSNPPATPPLPAA